MRPVDCDHWSDAGVVGGGRCALGRFGGLPSLGTCDRCLGLPARRPSEAAPVSVRAGPAVEGPRRWDGLHRRAFLWDGCDPAAELAHVTSLADGLGLCGCKRKWRDILDRMPPDLSSAPAYGAWTLSAHDEVNIELGRPLMAGVARAAYQPASPSIFVFVVGSKTLALAEQNPL